MADVPWLSIITFVILLAVIAMLGVVVAKIIPVVEGLSPPVPDGFGLYTPLMSGQSASAGLYMSNSAFHCLNIHGYVGGWIQGAPNPAYPNAEDAVPTTFREGKVHATRFNFAPSSDFPGFWHIEDADDASSVLTFAGPGSSIGINMTVTPNTTNFHGTGLPKVPTDVANWTLVPLPAGWSAILLLKGIELVPYYCPPGDQHSYCFMAPKADVTKTNPVWFYQLWTATATSMPKVDADNTTQAAVAKNHPANTVVLNCPYVAGAITSDFAAYGDYPDNGSMRVWPNQAQTGTPFWTWGQSLPSNPPRCISDDYYNGCTCGQNDYATQIIDQAGSPNVCFGQRLYSINYGQNLASIEDTAYEDQC